MAVNIAATTTIAIAKHHDNDDCLCINRIFFMCYMCDLPLVSLQRQKNTILVIIVTVNILQPAFNIHKWQATGRSKETRRLFKKI